MKGYTVEEYYSSHTRRISSIILLLVFATHTSAQVGINTENPEGILDVVSSNSAIIIPRNTNPVTNVTSPKEGMIIYNSSAKTVQCYDGTQWLTLASNVVEAFRNEGVVKVNIDEVARDWHSFFYNSNDDNNLEEYILIPLSLSVSIAPFPTTSWPENIVDPGMDDVYSIGDTSFLENPVMGQVHFWRIIVDYKGKSNGTTVDVSVRLRNPLTGFAITTTAVTPSKSPEGVLVCDMMTIADPGSLPQPWGNGTGYRLELTADGKIDLTVTSITRVSQKKD